MTMDPTASVSLGRERERVSCLDRFDIEVEKSVGSHTSFAFFIVNK